MPKPVSEADAQDGEDNQLFAEHRKTGGGIARRRVTITDLAEALGITKSTVSRALNDYPDISPVTRRRVQRQAERMGYRPLAQAQAIRTGRSKALGLIIQTGLPGAQRPFLADFLEGITRTASGFGWTLTVATATGREEMLATLARLVDERKADGFILPRTHSHDPRMEFLREASVPFVLYGRVADPKDCAWFDIRGESAIQSATQRLARHGHKRIGFVNGAATYNFSRLRAEGYRSGLTASGLPWDQDLASCRAMIREEGAEATRRLLALDRPPTAIVFATDAAALGAYEVAETLGLEIGADLSIISYDGIPEGRMVRPRLTTFSVDSRNAGERLATLLVERIRGSDPQTLRELADAELQVGGSDGPPRLSSEDLAKHLAARTA